ncbi:ammonia-forming cytochrome c nitrite reductase subunit c552 [candidate division KSB1 bacterium]|nr:ammonia-forming cytochrome c nitrite reductase subunit c552 [candidate division KSB1 bacterium]
MKKNRIRHKKSKELVQSKKVQPREVKPKVKLTNLKKTTIIVGVIIIIVISAFLISDFSNLKRLITGEFGNSIAGLDDLNYFPDPQKTSKTKGPRFEDFTGAESCMKCHKEQYNLWYNSTHGKAGGTPDKVKIISSFDTTLTYGDAIVTPSNEQDHKFTIELSNGQRIEYNIDAVIGGGHMVGGGTQSYFSKFPDGSYRFLPFDFSKQEDLWFSQIRRNNNWFPVNGELFLAELSDWPPQRILGTENSFTNCQNCHGSQIMVNYNLKKKKYETKFTSLKINCESCHGPGKRHIDLMNSKTANELEDIGLESLKTITKDESLNICFQCHAVKDPIKPNYLPGKALEEYYSLKLPILASNPYFEDGRVRRFAYQQNHLFSDCYLNGSMTCVDCHSPHSNQYRDINGQKLIGKFANGQCLSCHPSKTEKQEAHSRHKPDSKGNLCVTCHMPFLQHKNVGEHITFTRSDHTIPIPRPSFDNSIGIEDACHQCHKDKSIDWLQAKVDEWYGELKPHKESIANLFDLDTINDRKKGAEKLLFVNGNHRMAQTIGLSYFVKTFLSPDMPHLENEIIDRLKKLVDNKDLDIKSLALMILHMTSGFKPEIRNYLKDQLKNQTGQEHAVRARWALAMDYLGSVYAQKNQFDKAIQMHKKALEITPDDPFIWVNLGNSYGNRGLLNRAINCFIKASEIKPDYETALINLGSAYQRKGKKEKAFDAFQKATDVKPVNPETHISLARAYLNSGDMESAIEKLKLGLELIPNDPTIIDFLNNLVANRLNVN